MEIFTEFTQRKFQEKVAALGGGGGSAGHLREWTLGRGMENTKTLDESMLGY